jgi:hypothetical protein
MMTSIFDTAGNQKMIARIQALNSNSKALWGKMNAAQMCKHCANAIQVAQGNFPLKINFVIKILGKLLKNKVIHGDAFQKNSPTAKEFIITENLDLETEKANLIALFSTFATAGTAVIKDLQHPFWGKLTIEEWDLLMYKHLDHHLRQFGV